MLSHKFRLYLHLVYEMPSTSEHLFLLPHGIVCEPSSIRSLAADCPIIIIFKHSRLCLFHHYVVVNNALRVFQQFRWIHYTVTHVMDYNLISPESTQYYYPIGFLSHSSNCHQLAWRTSSPTT